MTNIICAGLIAVDLVFDVPAFPRKGSKNRAATCHMITGGGAMNAATAIAGLGGTACLAGVTGDDPFGAFLRTKMTDRGIDDRMVHTEPGVATSRSANMITPDGDRTIVNHRDAALTPAGFRLAPDVGFDAVLVDTRWPDGALRIVEAARRAQKPAVVDVEAPVAPAHAVLVQASHIAFSEQGLADFCGACDAAALERATKELGTWCAVTRGALPVLCHDGQRLTEVATYPTTAVNTLGAGDAWHGAFALALGQGRAEVDAVRWANATAALKICRNIDDETVPNAAEVERLLTT